jgi:hypothetical protein
MEEDNDQEFQTTDGHRRSFAYGINMAATLFRAGATIILAEQ